MRKDFLRHEKKLIYVNTILDRTIIAQDSLAHFLWILFGPSLLWSLNFHAFIVDPQDRAWRLSGLFAYSEKSSGVSSSPHFPLYATALIIKLWFS